MTAHGEEKDRAHTDQGRSQGAGGHAAGGTGMRRGFSRDAHGLLRQMGAAGGGASGLWRLPRRFQREEHLSCGAALRLFCQGHAHDAGVTSDKGSVPLHSPLEHESLCRTRWVSGKVRLSQRPGARHGQDPDGGV